MPYIRALIGTLLVLFVAGSAGAASPPGREVLQALAPTGKLRVGLYMGGPTNIIPGNTAEETKGVGYDLGKELARRLGVPFEPVVYPNAGAVAGGLKSGEWDIAFLAQSPERASIVSFTAPFLLIEHGFLVPAGSPITAIAEVDRPGVRIGVPQGGSVNAVLSGTIRHASIVPVPGMVAAADMVMTGQVDVFAASKANLYELADRLPNPRILDGHIGLDEIAIATPKGRDAGMPYLQHYLVAAKTEGIIDAALRRARVRGSVAK